MTKGEYKRLIDAFVQKEWNHLMECAHNIGRRSEHSAGDLVAELAIFLYDGQSKLQAYIDMDMLLGFSVSWMKTQSQFKTAPFARKYGRQDNMLDIADMPSAEEPSIEEDLDIDIDAYIKDLKSIYTDEQIANLLRIHDIYPTLSPIGKVIFDAYFIEGLSMDKIRQKYSFFRNKNGKRKFYKGRQSIFYMLRDLKKEIREKL